mmetsp:Transcript_45235/g.97007  ORF Transcript_45235/g.97007 Transcript_45235/m.97007 type:complete len:268 (-) Transcript_45235:1004-1807(-)
MTATLSPPSFWDIASCAPRTYGWASARRATVLVTIVSCSPGSTVTIILRAVALCTRTTPACPPPAHPANITAARGGGAEPKRSNIGANGCPVGCSTATWEPESSPESQSIPMCRAPISIVPGIGRTSMVSNPSAVVSTFLKAEPFASNSWLLEASAANRILWLCLSLLNWRSAADTKVRQASRSALTCSSSVAGRPLANVASSCEALARPSGSASATFVRKVSDQAWACAVHCAKTPSPHSGMLPRALAMSFIIVWSSPLQDLSSHM